ncbi:MAG: DUF2066 domain-containing protein [Parvibaculum sp.]|nr:DUF2066 domain-containing protein [Parvibaculum sp.]
MMGAFRLAVLTGLVLSVFGVFSVEKAVAADLYTIRGVHVDETAASATAARTTAQAKGQKIALMELMQRLTLAADWPRLPQVDDNTAQDAVRGFQVASEKASSTRYIAVLNVSFQPATVRNLLKRSGILYGETQAKPALVLAIYDKGGEPVFWEDANPWRDAIAKQDLDGAITPLLMPVGDVQEFVILTTAQAVSGDKAAIAALGERYGVDDVVVAIAKTNGESVGLTINRYGLGDLTPVKRTYQNLDAAASGLIDVLGDQWKRETVVAPGEQSHLTAAVIFSGLGQWESIRRGLGATPLVNGLQVEGITASGAEVQISYRGTPEKLALSLAQSNVVLEQSADGWTIRSN